MRLVDADALKNAFNVFYGGVGHAAIAAWIINDAPTVDAVEVVRCKDCENSEEGKIGYYCKFHDTGFAGDDFCSYGERKPNE